MQANTELRRLVAAVATSWPDAERSDALAVALADPEAALACWRALAAELPQTPADPFPALPTCNDCRNLSQYRDRDGFRPCTAAARGELPYVASRRYCPVPDVGRRCEGFRDRSAESAK